MQKITKNNTEPPAWAVELAKKIRPYPRNGIFIDPELERQRQEAIKDQERITILIADYFAAGLDVDELERLLTIKNDFAEVSEFGIKCRELLPSFIRRFRAQAADIRHLKLLESLIGNTAALMGQSESQNATQKENQES